MNIYYNIPKKEKIADFSTDNSLFRYDNYNIPVILATRFFIVSIKSNT